MSRMRDLFHRWTTRSDATPPLLKAARRLVILVVGSTVLLVGVALLVLPGPAFVVIPAGLAILSCEFVWAKRWLTRIRDSARQLGQQVQGRTKSKKPPAETRRSQRSGPTNSDLVA